MNHAMMKPGRRLSAASYANRCPECRHHQNDYGVAHFPDCRYFWTEEESDDETETIALHSRQLTIPASGFAMTNIHPAQ
jgi:hypothetical protein